MSETQKAWGRIESWLEKNSPDLLETFNPGASDEEIQTFEAHIGQSLPLEVRDYLRIHNGQDADIGQNLFVGLEFIPLKKMQRDWEKWKKAEFYNKEISPDTESHPANAIQLNYTNQSWIALTRDTGPSNHLGVDLAPGPAGTVGQVINFGRDDLEKYVLAPNWAEFLHRLADVLESKVTLVAEGGIEVAREDLEWLGRHFHDVLKEWIRDGKWPLPHVRE